MDINLSFRRSTKEDYSIIEELFMEGFGYRDDYLSDLDNRYILAFIEGELAGIIGLAYNKVYCGVEIDYCCVRKKFRHHHIMTCLFEENLKGVKERVYCCAWRIGDNEQSNLQGILESFGFVKVIDQMTAFEKGYNCHVKDLNGCSFYKEEKCKCFEDLWILEKQE